MGSLLLFPQYAYSYFGTDTIDEPKLEIGIATHRSYQTLVIFHAVFSVCRQNFLKLCTNFHEIRETGRP